jgi:hypothetical protein
MIMKTSLMIFTVFTLFITTSYSQMDTNYFRVTTATSQGWSGGAYGSGSGIKYVFDVSFKADVKLKFDTVWIAGGNGLVFRPMQAVGVDSAFKKGNTFTLYADQYFPGEIDRYKGKTPDKATSNPPVNYIGKALIRYIVNNKTYYYTVKEMESLQPLAYP